eukprot:scaffold12209_cov21-Tisochrysis_lutea.AAC.4
MSTAARVLFGTLIEKESKVPGTARGSMAQSCMPCKELYGVGLLHVVPAIRGLYKAGKSFNADEPDFPGPRQGRSDRSPPRREGKRWLQAASVCQKSWSAVGLP